MAGRFFTPPAGRFFTPPAGRLSVCGVSDAAFSSASCAHSSPGGHSRCPPDALKVPSHPAKAFGFSTPLFQRSRRLIGTTMLHCGTETLPCSSGELLGTLTGEAAGLGELELSWPWKLRAGLGENIAPMIRIARMGQLELA